MRIAYFLIFLVLPFYLNAQAGQGLPPGAKGIAVGKVVNDRNEEAVEYATVALMKEDSSLAGGTTTDSTGIFRLTIPEYGTYYLMIEFIGFKSSYTDQFTISDGKKFERIGLIRLEPADYALETVEIKGEQSEALFMLDKKSFDIGKDLSNIGGSATDVLEKIPSVTVDMDGNISLRGSANVRILIDGKPSSLTGISSSDILEQIPASSIERIEVITNPSAKYDAEGMTGIINIILKKQKSEGFNGMASVTGSTGKTFEGALNMNYKKGMFNFFGSYSARYRHRIGGGTAYRETFLQDTSFIQDQEFYFSRSGWSHTVKGGLDLFLNARNTLTLSALYRTGLGLHNSEVDYLFYDSAKELAFLSNRTAHETDKDRNMDYVLNYKKEFKKKRQELTLDVMYSNGIENEKSDLEQKFLLPDQSPMGIADLRQQTFSNEEQDNILVQLDYVYPIREKSNLEAGWKTNIRHISVDYDLEEYDPSTSNWEFLDNLSNHFLYDENIHAAYLIYSGKWKKFQYQGGVRSEYSTIQSHLKDTGEEFEKSYLDFFPSVHLSYAIKENLQLKASYSRRIDRPSFWNLNPFFSYTDPLNLRTGNPDLNPEYIHSAEAGILNFGKKGTISSSIYYRHTNDVIGRIMEVEPSGVSVTTYENLYSSDAFGLEFYFSRELFSWWNINVSGNYYYNSINGDNYRENFGVEYFGWFGRMMSSWTAPADINIQLMTLFRGPMAMPQGKIKEIFWADLSVRKDILDGRGSLSLRLSDIFGSRKFIIEAEDVNYVTTRSFDMKSRHLYLSFSYKFNNYKQRDRNRNGGDMDMEDAGF